MALMRNIGSGGRWIRALAGVLCLLAAFFLLLWVWPDTAAWHWLVAAGLLLAGVFQIIEGAIGWCALRAMGRKTPF
jgi:predicted lysophospholipase L1 biosynthesis ABC-type transport system permease subunit